MESSTRPLHALTPAHKAFSGSQIYILQRQAVENKSVSAKRNKIRQALEHNHSDSRGGRLRDSIAELSLCLSSLTRSCSPLKSNRLSSQLLLGVTRAEAMSSLKSQMRLTFEWWEIINVSKCGRQEEKHVEWPGWAALDNSAVTSGTLTIRREKIIYIELYLARGNKRSNAVYPRDTAGSP
ncbi:hypothetical protein RRG08_062083 [Elysia crispata]|uniref:Uncharacterized protein n=1 Tax=Elysia crispata TaxID=231223 RepID=A0AAE0ZI48_9GAST|nr:hypothetical protein RRG08_062083 [Elysia crispata]